MPSPLSPTDTPAVPDLLNDLQHQLAVFARRAEQTRLAGLGQVRNSMDRAAYLLLNRLEQHGPTGVKALAAGMGIDSSTVTRQVAPLVDSGLVKRATHPEDGRAVVLELTPLGTSRLHEVQDSRRELVARLTSDWTQGERATFCTLLTRFNTTVSQANADQQEGRQPGRQDGEETAERDGLAGPRDGGD
ncbi:MarR family winged helix-turn-helix transcriptional regulator [Streptomyces phytophilus]|uniref:MarR family winged helix-turn-helix transcriptional regulator n=1 Tax=Streptomyces phytophilus TaxID=722715 RepID=UPI0015F00126|nr:MarR family winged helix-turn-helix transcriptional regulator [Streptomyces phytophilus]